MTTADPHDAMPRAIAICGPTAAGKEALGVEAAERLGLPVLVCDSVKVYRRLDIGSAKPSAEVRARVPHRLLDLVDPDATFSAGDYARAAWRELGDAQGGGLFVGGAGFYLAAVAWTPTPAPEGADVPPSDPVRAAFEARWRAAESATPGAMHRALAALDSRTAEAIHPHNLVRILRALWLCEVCGGPVSVVRSADPPRRRLRVLMVVLDPGVAELDARIEARVGSMLEAGWVQEVEDLARDGYDARCKAMQSLGYKELLDVVHGRASLADARVRIAAATRQLARRQRTYLRAQPLADEVVHLGDPRACPWPRLRAFLHATPVGTRT
jgi:tRNA dimethylallyltransferase